jgi:hypothetical protein
MHKLPVSEFSQLYGQTFIEGYILAWPLIVACSIKTGNKDSSFHPQYLVPQMLLQWVCDEQKVDGIRYFSTRTPRGGFPYYNFAFPARVIKSEGRCAHLQKKFTLTDPISWLILREINLPGFVDASATNWKTDVTLTKDLPFTYSQTGFYLAEQTLKYLADKYPDWLKRVGL